MNVIYTIGHSTNSIDEFIGSLKQHGITAVADVRSAPYSRFNPQFNRETLLKKLQDCGIKYAFLGKELGARSDDPSCYRDSKVRYDLLAKTDLFKDGLERVKEGAQDYRIALMCAEKDPLDCHRTILVARKLVEQGLTVKHILADGGTASHEEVLDRLLDLVGLGSPDFFRTKEDAIREAYEKRGEAIAYSEADAKAGDDEPPRQHGFG